MAALIPFVCKGKSLLLEFAHSLQKLLMNDALETLNESLKIVCNKRCKHLTSIYQILLVGIAVPIDERESTSISIFVLKCNMLLSRPEGELQFPSLESQFFLIN